MIGGKFWRRASALAIVGVLGLLLFGFFRIKTIERDALQLAATGRGGIAVLNRLAAGVLAQDLDAIAAVYGADYRNEEGAWRVADMSDQDGILKLTWRPGRHEETDLEGVVANYRVLFSGLASVDWAKVKLARVESTGSEGPVDVRAVLWLRGQTVDGQTSESQLRLELTLSTPAENASIISQHLVTGTTVAGAGTGFADRAPEIGLDFSSATNPRFSDPDWKLEKFGIARYASPGVSAVDYDGDGWYDLYYTDGESARLYRNESGTIGELRFRDVTTEVGLPIDLPGINMGLFVDLDNDGDRDLFIGRFMNGNRLYRNDGGRFTQVQAPKGMAQGFVTTASAADYDGDGFVDLYLGRYLDPRSELPLTLFYTRNGQGNSLFRNEGGLTFTDVTETAGVREGGLTLGTSWADYDDDGDPDLHVANDFGRNALLRNEGDGTFTDVTAEAGALDFGFGMSSSWGDVDNDGDFDIYVSNVHSSQRWYGQAATLGQYLLTSVKQGTIFEDFSLYREIYGYTGPDWGLYGDGMVKGNSLLLNDGKGHFTESSEIAGSNPYGWYWGSAFFDYDNDGRLDIYAANGWISGKTMDDL